MSVLKGVLQRQCSIFFLLLLFIYYNVSAQRGFTTSVLKGFEHCLWECSSPPGPESCSEKNKNKYAQHPNVEFRKAKVEKFKWRNGFFYAISQQAKDVINK